ncbi:hypothetical protein ACTWPT_54850 [Nonomuraea sp. 3N208]|uniref:hypothetical protein n=1 Tax=Nonomuraea sp. 3N208 TaxID=3457421 RepID=UPI003FD0350C
MTEVGLFGGYHQVPPAQRLWIWATDPEQARNDLPLAWPGMSERERSPGNLLAAARPTTDHRQAGQTPWYGWPYHPWEGWPSSGSGAARLGRNRADS